MSETRSTSWRVIAATAVIASCVVLVAPSSAASDPGTGSISGTVLDAQGQPLGNVCVWVQNVAGTTTDGAGQYFVDNVPVGQHRVQFSECGVEPTHLTQWYLGADEESTATPVDVVDQTNTTLSDVHMVQGVSVTGTVTDTTNAPVKDIRVELQPQDPSNSYNSGNTDIDGRYRTGPVASGRYKVRFVDNQYPARYAFEYWNDVYIGADAQTLDLQVTNGPVVANIDAQMTYGATVTGTATNENSQPLSQICVNVESPGEQRQYLGGATTDLFGKYSISGLPPVSAVVYFHDCNNPSAYVDQWFNGTTDRDSAQQIALNPGGTQSGVNAQMTLGAKISGTVTGTGGAPVANICVQSVMGSENDRRGVAWDQTDASGNYELEALEPGTHRVQMMDCNNVGPYLDQWYSGSDSIDGATAIELTAGQSRTGVNAQMQLASQITGTVRNTGGTPLEHVCVQASTDGFVGGMADTGSDGTYSIKLSRGGKYKVQFVDCGDPDDEPPVPGGTYLAQWWGGGLEPSTARTIDVVTGATVDNIDATLTEAAGTGTVSGRITNVRGEPLTACIALYLPFNHVRFAMTDDSGDYVFNGVPTGTWAIAFVGCGSEDALPVIPDTGGTGVFFEARWYDGVPLVLGDKGPDPIAQGANFVTISPNESVKADACFGCGSIEVKPPVIGDGYILVDFDTTGLAKAAGPNAAARTDLTYSVACESKTGKATRASQADFPVKVSGFTPGAPYVCSARVLSNNVAVADSTTFEVTVGKATPAVPSNTVPADPATPAEPSQPSDNTGGNTAPQTQPTSQPTSGYTPARLAYTGGNIAAVVALAVFMVLMGVGVVATTTRTNPVTNDAEPPRSRRPHRPRQR